MAVEHRVRLGQKESAGEPWLNLLVQRVERAMRDQA